PVPTRSIMLLSDLHKFRGVGSKNTDHVGAYLIQSSKDGMVARETVAAPTKLDWLTVETFEGNSRR
ncbi:MAG: hypothetical protein Q9204_003125, partial [Flavoplaca sp. TL-2023a]